MSGHAAEKPAADQSLLYQPGRVITDPETRQGIRETVELAHSSMEADDRQVEPPAPIHHYADGMYGRELHLPAGMVIATKIHLTNHFLFVMQGRAQVIDENHGAEEIVAPCMIQTKRGTKRIWRVLEDLVIITTHATNKRNVADIEADIIAGEYLETEKSV